MFRIGSVTHPIDQISHEEVASLVLEKKKEGRRPE